MSSSPCLPTIWVNMSPDPECQKYVHPSFHHKHKSDYIHNLLNKTSSAGEACWWTVHPASKQRSEGEKVRVGDDVIFVSVATERYLVQLYKQYIITTPSSTPHSHIPASHQGEQPGHRERLLPRDSVERVSLRHRPQSAEEPAVCVRRRRAQVGIQIQTFASFVRNCG